MTPPKPPPGSGKSPACVMFGHKWGAWENVDGSRHIAAVRNCTRRKCPALDARMHDRKDDTRGT